jgi:hypothetical protein
MSHEITVYVQPAQDDAQDDGSSVAMVPVLVHLPVATAEALAAARIARAGSDLLAADCKPIAHAVADALIDLGLSG